MTISLNEILWSTRGFEWDFRILRQPPGGCDWLLVYEEFFKGTEYEDQFFTIRDTAARSPQKERCIALRFPDPQDRKDRSGRLIPHEFVIFGKSAEGIESWEQARDAVWPLVEAEYAKLYDTNPFRTSDPVETVTTTVAEKPLSPNETPENESAASHPNSHRVPVVIIGFLVILSLLLYAFYPSGTTGVQGTVKFSDGTPLHTGTIVWSTDGETRTARVDEKGNYRLDQIKPGKYAISFTGEATTLVDPKYLKAETSDLLITLDKPQPFSTHKERVVDFSVEKNITALEDVP